MQILAALAVLVASYLMGAIPFGVIVVRLATGKDVRRIESGRTGGTNALRAAGLWAGLATAFLDILKGACAVWLARWVLPVELNWREWIVALAPVASILGHNYSIYLIERDSHGKLKIHGGAGGAPCGGGAVGLWAPSILFLVPVGALILYLIGYASVATMSIAAVMTVIFTVRAAMGISPWEYVIFGVLSEVLLIWALRPNIRRLRNGTERLVGLRAKRRLEKNQSAAKDSE